MKYYTIYQITDLLNGKIYIGKHETYNLNDSYMGSGKLLIEAQKKHGLKNFKKDILFIFDNEEEMNKKEAELVSEEFCLHEYTYNICPGGKGGWGYVNKNDISNIKWKTNFECRDYQKTGGRKGAEITNSRYEMSEEFKKARLMSFKGKSHTKETKDKIAQANSEHQKGDNNSQFGTIWITNGFENKKIKKFDTIPLNWYKGRKVNAPLV